MSLTPQQVQLSSSLLCRTQATPYNDSQIHSHTPRPSRPLAAHATLLSPHNMLHNSSHLVLPANSSAPHVQGALNSLHETTPKQKPWLQRRTSCLPTPPGSSYNNTGTRFTGPPTSDPFIAASLKSRDCRSEPSTPEAPSSYSPSSRGALASTWQSICSSQLPDQTTRSPGVRLSSPTTTPPLQTCTPVFMTLYPPTQPCASPTRTCTPPSLRIHPISRALYPVDSVPSPSRTPRTVSKSPQNEYTPVDPVRLTSSGGAKAFSQRDFGSTPSPTLGMPSPLQSTPEPPTASSVDHLSDGGESRRDDAAEASFNAPVTYNDRQHISNVMTDASVQGTSLQPPPGSSARTSTPLPRARVFEPQPLTLLAADIASQQTELDCPSDAGYYLLDARSKPHSPSGSPPSHPLDEIHHTGFESTQNGSSRPLPPSFSPPSQPLDERGRISMACRSVLDDDSTPVPTWNAVSTPQLSQSCVSSSSSSSGEYPTQRRVTQTATVRARAARLDSSSSEAQSSPEDELPTHRYGPHDLIIFMYKAGRIHD